MIAGNEREYRQGYDYRGIWHEYHELPERIRQISHGLRRYIRKTTGSGKKAAGSDPYCQDQGDLAVVLAAGTVVFTAVVTAVGFAAAVELPAFAVIVDAGTEAAVWLPWSAAPVETSADTVTLP